MVVSPVDFWITAFMGFLLYMLYENELRFDLCRGRSWEKSIAPNLDQRSYLPSLGVLLEES